jgi:beta-1,4-mannosyl-glycoprotein beta-1,4-N-acetylglucosaminyltransferase
MKLFDCFIFDNELELLELRLKETEGIVDKWVIVECATNFKQKPKPLNFRDNKERFAPYLDRIYHVTIEDNPIGPHPIIEHYQRRQLSKAWKEAGAAPGDLIIISDADEIPNPAVLKALLANPPTAMVVLKQRLYYYTVDCLQNQSWKGPILFVLGDGEYDAQQIRGRRRKIQAINNGGWHFSWLGPLKKIQYKLECIDVERDSNGLYHSPDVHDVSFLNECINSGKDLFGRTDELSKKQFISLSPGVLHPHSIIGWLKKYPEFVHKPI